MGGLLEVLLCFNIPQNTTSWFLIAPFHFRWTGTTAARVCSTTRKPQRAFRHWTSYGIRQIRKVSWTPSLVGRNAPSRPRTGRHFLLQFPGLATLGIAWIVELLQQTSQCPILLSPVSEHPISDRQPGCQTIVWTHILESKVKKCFHL